MREVLWQWPEICAALGLPEHSGPEVKGVVVDSRLVREGDLFVALPGDPGPRFTATSISEVDGHDYVANAAVNGAVGAIVHREVKVDAPLLHVDNTYDALWRFGAAARQRINAPTVAITGSSGKTTAKTYFLQATRGYGSPGSFNNHIGVPLTLINAPLNAPLYAFEIGTNHPGEIAPLAELAAADAAVLLNVQSAHIENFANQAALRDEKVSIFSALSDKDHAVWEETLGLSFGHAFGTRQGSACRLLDLKGDRGVYELFGQQLSAKVPDGARHSAMTVAAVLLTLELLSFDLEGALSLDQAALPAGRGNTIETGDICIVDQSYNANPDSMAAALDAFTSTQAARHIVVLGEMLELGGLSEAAHQRVVESLGARFEHVFLVGEGFERSAMQADLFWRESADAQLVDTLLNTLQPGDAIMLKGSNRVFWQKNFVEELVERVRKR